MKKIPININILEYPNELQNYLTHTNIYDSSSSKEAKVLYLDSGYYLKIANKGLLEREAILDKWFYAKGMGIEVIKYLSLEKDYLLIKEAVGDDCTSFIDNPKKLCEILSSTLKKLHSLDFSDFPYRDKMNNYFGLAKSNYEKGLFSEYVLLPMFNINSKEEAWDIVCKNIHLLKEDTLLHGDYCLPNIILNNYTFSSFIDLGMSGIGDKHIDIFWAIWSINYNLKDEQYIDYFLNLYGRENIDFNILRLVCAIEAFG